MVPVQINRQARRRALLPLLSQRSGGARRAAGTYANMVPTGEIIVSLTFAFVWTSSTTRAGTRVINNIQGKAAISGMSGSIGDREGGVANGNTTFPGEEPSEIQLHDWIKSYRQLLRQKQLLNFAESVNPERLAEYKAGIPIPVDENASDAVKTAIAAKNATISTTNFERTAKWEDHGRRQHS